MAHIPEQLVESFREPFRLFLHRYGSYRWKAPFLASPAALAFAVAFDRASGRRVLTRLLIDEAGFSETRARQHASRMMQRIDKLIRKELGRRGVWGEYQNWLAYLFTMPPLAVYDDSIATEYTRKTR